MSGSKRSSGCDTVVPVDTLEKDLARIIGFVGNCDSKASIILGATMTSVSLILGLCGSAIAGCADSANVLISGTVWVLVVSSAVLLMTGVSYLLSTLYARGLTDGEREERGTVFFGDIASVKLEKYREMVLAKDADGYIREITEQIHVNARICEKKYRYYDRGLVFSVLGVSLMVLLAVICLVC